KRREACVSCDRVEPRGRGGAPVVGRQNLPELQEDVLSDLFRSAPFPQEQERHPKHLHLIEFHKTLERLPVTAPLKDRSNILVHPTLLLPPPCPLGCRRAEKPRLRLFATGGRSPEYKRAKGWMNEWKSRLR